MGAFALVTEGGAKPRAGGAEGDLRIRPGAFTTRDRFPRSTPSPRPSSSPAERPPRGGGTKGGWGVLGGAGIG